MSAASLERQIIDQVRIVMYGDTDDLMESIKYLAQLIAHYDGVEATKLDNKLLKMAGVCRLLGQINSKIGNDYRD